MSKHIKAGRIIGFTGLAGAGKNTAAFAVITSGDAITYQYAFAAPIKEAAKAAMGWTDEHVDGELKELVDPLYGVSPRYVMQTLGTEWGRNMIRDELWILRAKRFIDSCRELTPNCTIVITDVRYDNEAAFIRELGGTILEIVRLDNDKPVLNHVSESGVHLAYVAKVINNDGTEADLHKAVLEALSPN